MNVIIWCICALVILLLFLWWYSKRKHIRKELAGLLSAYSESTKALAKVLRMTFDKAREGTATEADEDRVENFLCQWITIDAQLRVKIKRSRFFLNPGLIKRLQTFLYNEGSIRHVSPKDLEKFLDGVSANLQNIKEMLLNSTNQGS